MKKIYATSSFAGEGFAAGRFGLDKNMNPYQKYLDENHLSMSDSDFVFYKRAAMQWMSGWNMSKCNWYSV